MSFTTKGLSVAAGLALAMTANLAFAQASPPATGGTPQSSGGYQHPPGQAGNNGAMDHPSQTQAEGLRGTHPAASSTSAREDEWKKTHPKHMDGRVGEGRERTADPTRAPEAQHSEGTRLNSGTSTDPAPTSASSTRP